MGQLLFTGSKAWNDDYMGPAMMAPPLFSMLVLLGGFALLLLYCSMDGWYRWNASYQAIPQITKPEKEERPLESREFEVFSIDDSANETSDGKFSDREEAMHADWYKYFALVPVTDLFWLGVSDAIMQCK